MLRIDVNGTTVEQRLPHPVVQPVRRAQRPRRDLGRGLRNPWRYSFDRATGDLWIGDVGQDSYEEIDRAIPATPARAGPQLGLARDGGPALPHSLERLHHPGKVLPLIEYTHASNDRCAVTGGYVYRGSAIPALVGWYVYGDYCSGEIWAVKANDSYPTSRVTLVGAGSGRMISSFGESASGELFVVDLNGTISVIAPAL